MQAKTVFMQAKTVCKLTYLDLWSTIKAIRFKQEGGGYEAKGSNSCGGIFLNLPVRRILPEVNRYTGRDEEDVHGV